MTGTLVNTTVNGDAVQFACPTDESLMDCLRDRVGLTGVKEGCGTGDCGACSICLLYTSPSPRDATLSRMPSSA